jgi:ribonuclease HII
MPRETPEARRTRLWAEEHAAFAAGARCVAGVDEAGRGPLAGPLVVAAVILPPDWCPDGLNDSKQVPRERREALCAAISAVARCAVAVVDVVTIDRLNILGATHAGMRAVLRALAPDLALVDGNPLPHPPVPARNLVKGDARSASIAAASILAKVTRDRLLCDLDAAYPAYGFARHAGYGTPDHLAALRAHGPCPQHRRSFAPVRDCGQGVLFL